jgi:hypothetical protein
MSYQLTVTGVTPQGLIDNMTIMLALLKAGNGATGEAIRTAATAVLSASDKTQIGKDATVVEAKGGKPTETKPEPEPETEATTSVDDDDDGLGEGGAAEEAVTRDDVQKLLVEIKDAFKDKNPKIITEIVGKIGEKKFSEVPDAKLGELFKVAKTYAAKIKK